MLSIASAAVQTRGGAFVERLAVALARLEGWLAAERHQLVLGAPVMLGAGMAGYFGLPDAAHWPAAICAGMAVATVGLAVRGLGGRCLLWGGLLFALGAGLAWARRAGRRAAPRAVDVRPDIRGDGRAGRAQAAQERYRLPLHPADANLPPQVRVSLREAPPSGIRPGAQVRLRATLRPPPGPSVPGGYDFAQRARFEASAQSAMRWARSS